MELQTMTPADDWEPAPDTEDAVLALGERDYEFHVWGGDWCIDCEDQLPAFGAALDYAGVDDDRIQHYPTEKEDDGSKTGPGVETYGIEFIPTVVVEHDARRLRGSWKLPRSRLRSRSVANSGQQPQPSSKLLAATA